MTSGNSTSSVNRMTNTEAAEGCKKCSGDGVRDAYTCGTRWCKCDGFGGGCSEQISCECQPEPDEPEPEPDYDPGEYIYTSGRRILR